jgi:hypothetical protein
MGAYKGRQEIGGQHALYPFNLLLSNWSTPGGLNPAGQPQTAAELMGPPPTAEQMVAAIQALLGLQTSQPQIVVMPVQVPVPAPAPTPAPAPAPAGPSVEDRLARIEAALAALAAK